MLLQKQLFTALAEQFNDTRDILQFGKQQRLDFEVLFTFEQLDSSFLITYAADVDFALRALLYQL